MKHVLCAAAVLLTAPAAARAQRELDVEAVPSTLTLGPGAEAALRARDARDARWVTSLGHVVAGRFLPDGRRAPGFAVAAADDGGRRGATIIRLVGQGALPTHTAPGAEVTVIIAGAQFGPVIADRRGDAPVRVDVPPGAREALVVAVDRDGLSTQRAVPLPAEPVVPGVILAPTELAAGERGLVTIFAIDDHGRWRDPAAPPPAVLVDPAALAVVGSARAVAPGRWELEVEARAPGLTTVAASIEGSPLETSRVRVRPRRGGLRLLAGLRAGVATAFGPLVSLAAAADVGLRGRALGGDLEVTFARGSAATFRDVGVPATLTQLTVAALARVRLPARARPAFELFAGAGVAWGTTTRGTNVSPLLLAGGALFMRAGPGALVADLRWMDVRYHDVEGAGFGLVLTAGYRAEL